MSDTQIGDFGELLLGDQFVNPVASVKADVSQNSAGMWRGSVEVRIEASVDFDSIIDTEKPVSSYDEIVCVPDDINPVHVPEVSVHGFTVAKGFLTDGGNVEVDVFVSVPTQKEMELRETVIRLLGKVGGYVKATVDFYNDEAATEAKVKVKAKSPAKSQDKDEE